MLYLHTFKQTIQMMNWDSLLTCRRTGQSVGDVRHDRTEFQRDFDRLVFSSPFRRLQNKTQVFPLPGSVFVHNRLTHSMEVASVGRSLGSNIGRWALQEGLASNEYLGELGSIVASACLAHDMGNPPFGHSGEKAISHYFSNCRGAEMIERGGLTDAERTDLVCFDGNANSFRLLAHSFTGRRKGGFALTYPTLASIIKYPRPSADGCSKFGYFQQDKELFLDIMNELRMKPIDDSGERFVRYPFVYLVEAADDICYQVMDVEDSCRLGILSYDETRELLMGFFDPQADSTVFSNMDEVFRQVTDTNERVAYMRSKVIGRLVGLCTQVFKDNVDAIFSGTFTRGLIDHLPPFEQKAMDRVKEVALSRIYKHRSVVEIELSGFTILGTLLDEFVTALDSPDMYRSRLLMPFFPEQYRVAPSATVYDKMLAAVDVVSGMTDIYALDLFRKLKGITLRNA